MCYKEFNKGLKLQQPKGSSPNSLVHLLKWNLLFQEEMYLSCDGYQQEEWCINARKKSGMFRKAAINICAKIRISVFGVWQGLDLD